MKMCHPFDPDPFALVYQAFQNLYPGKECRIMWADHIEHDEDGDACGVTDFVEGEVTLVCVNATIPVFAAVEILAHELAHVAVAPVDPEEEHGEEWEKAFSAINDEYKRIGRELYPDLERVAFSEEGDAADENS